MSKYIYDYLLLRRFSVIKRKYGMVRVLVNDRTLSFHFICWKKSRKGSDGGGVCE